MDYTIQELCQYADNPIELAHWLIHERLISTRADCEMCGYPLHLEELLSIPDGVVWRCTYSRCRKRYSIRGYSIFAESNIPIFKVLEVIGLFCVNVGNRHTGQILDLSTHTIQRIYDKLGGLWLPDLREFSVFNMAVNVTSMRYISATLIINVSTSGLLAFLKGQQEEYICALC
jgi:hypothetical protein